MGYDEKLGTQVLGRLDELLKSKLADGATIEFAGCNTAKGSENIAKWVSELLPGIRVIGGASYQLGYIEGVGVLISLDGPNGMLGIKKVYLTIEGVMTHERVFISIFD